MAVVQAVLLGLFTLDVGVRSELREARTDRTMDRSHTYKTACKMIEDLSRSLSHPSLYRMESFNVYRLPTYNVYVRWLQSVYTLC